MSGALAELEARGLAGISNLPLENFILNGMGDFIVGSLEREYKMYEFLYFYYKGSLCWTEKYNIITQDFLEKGLCNMSLSYKKLWKQLIDRDMTRTELRQATGISPSTFARLSKGDYVASSVIDRICQELKCDVGDVMEVVLDDPDKKGKK